jgi:transaldolase
MYVEPLIGPQTINTMPRKTSAAFEDHGKAAATLEQGLEQSAAAIRDLETIGIDLEQVTARLLDVGIEKFVEAFDAVLETIAAKAERGGGRLVPPGHGSTRHEHQGRH